MNPPLFRPTPIARMVIVASMVAALLATMSPLAGADEGDDCTATRIGDVVTLSWTDDGGRHAIRRDDDWLATPGTGVDSFIDQSSPAGSTYVVRTRSGPDSTDRTCTEAVDGPSGCAFTRVGTTTTIEWADNGGSHVLRRDDRWLATPGIGASMYVDQNAPANSTYELRTRVVGDLSTTPCEENVVEPPQPPDAVAERVIHVSIDGLRVDAITPDLMPNLSRLVDEGASTMNARTDPKVTRTLPNHTSQLTGLAVKFHGVDYNEDEGRTVHDEANRYVASAYDVVHDNGGRTAAFVGKSKFYVHDRTWDGTNGAPDTTGDDDGRDKIDRFERAIPELTADMLLDELANEPDLEYSFFHIRYPDRAGHDFGWSSNEYAEAVTISDQIFGRLLDAVEADPALATSTSFIVVSDHGGPLGSNTHADPSLAENYTIPFIVWGPSVTAGADLYELNAGHRADPGTDRVWLGGQQPIRGHEVANLALGFLGYPPVPGSTFNSAQDLAVN